MSAVLVDPVEADDDLLSGIGACTRYLQVGHADRMERIHEFVMRYAADAQVVALAGREKMIAYGGSGTPVVPEFAVTQLHGELGESAWHAQQLVADTMSLIYRLPRIFQTLANGDVTVERARMVASTTRALSLQAVGRVEDLLMGGPQFQPLVSRITRKRLNEMIEQAVAVEDADTVEDQLQRALADRRVSFRPGLRGITELFGTVSTADGARLRQRLAQVVAWLVETGDGRTKDELASVALGMLADPATIEQVYARVHAVRTGQAALDDSLDVDVDVDVRPIPETVLYVHLDRGSGTWSMDRSGPITQAEAEDLVGHSHVVLKPVIDLAQNLTYTSYQAPARLREQLALLNAGRCTFPYCDRPAWTGDYDHITEYPRGPTSSRNGHLPCRHHHRVKTHGRWSVVTPTPGVWIWTSPDDQMFLVTEGTTTRLH